MAALGVLVGDGLTICQAIKAEIMTASANFITTSVIQTLVADAPQATPGYCDAGGVQPLALVALSPGLSRELQNFPLFAADDAGDVIGPSSQSDFLFVRVSRPIVDTRHAGLVTAGMV